MLFALLIFGHFGRCGFIGWFSLFMWSVKHASDKMTKNKYVNHPSTVVQLKRCPMILKSIIKINGYSFGQFRKTDFRYFISVFAHKCRRPKILCNTMQSSVTVASAVCWVFLWEKREPLPIVAWSQWLVITFWERVLDIACVHNWPLRRESMNPFALRGEKPVRNSKTDKSYETKLLKFTPSAFLGCINWTNKHFIWGYSIRKIISVHTIFRWFFIMCGGRSARHTNIRF